MKASDYIAKKLSQYTNVAFTGQGGSVVHILDSIKKFNKIKIIPSQNEQGASLAADAFSRLSKKIGFVIATSGPGIINCFQGIACSYYDSIPSLYIAGAPARSALRKNLQLRQLGFQEMDVSEIVKSFTKYSIRITDPNDIRYEIEKCIWMAQNGRKGPCLIDLPDDIQRIEINQKKQKKFIPPLKKKIDKIDNLNQILKLIDNSKKPLIILGGGIKNMSSQKIIKKFLLRTGFPYALSWGAIDLFDHNENLNVGSFGVYATRYGNYTIQNADLLIVLGCRLNGTLIGGNPKLFSPKSKKILVDIDKAELKEENRVKIDFKLNCNLNFFLQQINKKIKKQPTRTLWIKQIKKWKVENPILLNEYSHQKKFVNPYIFFNYLSDLTSKNDIIIPDASANLVWAYQGLKFKKKQRVFTSLNHSPMGYSVAAAVGASLALHKKNKIIPIIGDGSMQMNIQEIQNIKFFNLPIKIFILNNEGYGMVKQTIDTWLNSNYVGCDLKSDLSLPNYLSVFNAYGIKTVRIKNQNNIKNKLKNVLNFNGPIMCEVMINPDQRIEPKVKFGSPLDIMLP